MFFDEIGLKVPRVLLPAPGVDLRKWAVVACDQYTSEPEYWERVKAFVGGAPSTLNITLPEIFLDSPAEDRMIEGINRTMRKYVEDRVLVEHKPGFVLIDRQTVRVQSRKGLLVALDLEKYDFSEGSQSLIRATEGTILERIPPRVRIRKDAPLELPHIMVLIDDPSKTVIEPLFNKKRDKLYETDLMMDSGRVTAYLVDDEGSIHWIQEKLAGLADPGRFARKYGVDGKGVLLYAMGDGNHSLATAKTIWETLKAGASDKKAVMGHPARFALVELVNVHDEGLEFEPIHRVVFNANPAAMLERMTPFYKAQGSEFSVKACGSREEAFAAARARDGGRPCHRIVYSAAGAFGAIRVTDPKRTLESGTLQSFLDPFLKAEKDAKIDYIHGDDVVEELSSKPGSIGFYLPPMRKSDLFRTVVIDGALPRKTFSMGEASEKRFYLECRGIV